MQGNPPWHNSNQPRANDPPPYHTQYQYFHGYDNVLLQEPPPQYPSYQDAPPPQYPPYHEFPHEHPSITFQSLPLPATYYNLYTSTTYPTTSDIQPTPTYPTNNNTQSYDEYQPSVQPHENYSTYPTQVFPKNTLDERISKLISLANDEHRFGKKIQALSIPLISHAPHNGPEEKNGFVHTPSFQEFAGATVYSLNQHTPLKMIYEDLECKVRDYVVHGTISSKRPFGLIIQVDEVSDFHGRLIFPNSLIRSFKIEALCHVSELSNNEGKEQEDRMEEYNIGDCVKAVLLAVDIPNERILLSFRISHLPRSVAFTLACILVISRIPVPTLLSFYEFCDEFHEFLPQIQTLGRQQEKSTYREPDPKIQPFNQCLRSQAIFHNPYTLDSMMKYYTIMEDSSPDYPLGHYYDKLRDFQNVQWARETVAKGIAFAKQGDYKKAMQCYQQALEVDPSHRDAFVARGAAYANLNMLGDAIEEFERALSIDPDDRNARKYLTVTKEKLRERTADDKEKGSEKLPIDVDKESEELQISEKLKTLLEAEERERKSKKKKKKSSKKSKKSSDKKHHKSKRRSPPSSDSGNESKHRKHHKSKRTLTDSSSSDEDDARPPRKHHKSRSSPDSYSKYESKNSRFSRSPDK